MRSGVAIWLSVVIASLAFTLHTTYVKQILMASTFLFLVGLVDDVLQVVVHATVVPATHSQNHVVLAVTPVSARVVPV
mgnify:CR=1 FL=1